MHHIILKLNLHILINFLIWGLYVPHFSNEDNSFNQDISSSEKEPEMFAEDNKEEDFEIPAFLRKQKN